MQAIESQQFRKMSKAELMRQYNTDRKHWMQAMSAMGTRMAELEGAQIGVHQAGEMLKNAYAMEIARRRELRTDLFGYVDVLMDEYGKDKKVVMLLLNFMINKLDDAIGTKQWRKDFSEYMSEKNLSEIAEYLESRDGT